MALTQIDPGSSPNDGTGTTLRAAATLINLIISQMWDTITGGIAYLTGDAGVPASSGTVNNAVTTVGNVDTFTTLYTGAYLASPFGIWIQVDSRNALGNYKHLSINPDGGNVGVGKDDPGSIFAVSC